MNRKRLFLAVLALVVVGALAVMLSSRSTDAVRAPTEPSAPRFSVLEPATPAEMDAISEEAKMRLDFMASHPELPGARSAPEGGVPVSRVGVVKRSNGESITVAAVGGAICAFLAEGVGGCDSAQRVAAGQSFSAEPFDCDRFRVLGVVPDGVASIAIDGEEDGEVDSTLPVTSNVYVGVLDPVGTIATGLDGSGNVRFNVELPLDYYASTQRNLPGLNC